jgi:hypothetical protein
MVQPDTWLAWKKGDHLQEGTDLVAKFVAEVGQRAAVDDVNVRRTRTPDGTTLTLIAASDTWWHEQMRVHPNGWRGASMAAIADRFDS